MTCEWMRRRRDRHDLHFHQIFADNIFGHIGQRTDDPERASPFENHFENGAERFDIEAQGNIRKA